MTRVLRSATKKSQNSEDLSSKLNIIKYSKNIKRGDNKVIKIKKEVKKSDISDINTLISIIFAYTDHKDLIEINTACKKWNNLTNPIIHKTIKLTHSWNIIDQAYDKMLNYYAKIEAEVDECIYNNSKYAQFVKEFTFKSKLAPQRAIEFFDNFRFISNLTIDYCNMSKDQFLVMISPLTQLQELSIRSLEIKKIVYKRLYKEVVQLPLTLKKLRIESLRLISNPELFIQTINSHNNLIEFYIQSYSTQVF
jgi:hypothetical protein